MSVSPQPPARAGFSDAQAQTDVTHAPGSGNADHPQAGSQAEKAFLRRHQLPQRWAGRPRFVVLETNFGLGHHFLATWAAWRADPQRCRQLVFVSIAPRGQSQADLHQAHRGSPQPALAQALMAQWPPTTPDIHLLDFDGGAVRLLLALGDVAQVLPDLVLQADAVYLGEGPGQASDIDSGAGPDRPPVRPHPRLLRHLQRLAAAGCTVASAHGDSGLRQALTSTGFVLDAPTDAARTDGPVTGHYAPRHHSQAPPGRQGQAGVRHVAVVGAGLAGAAVARALAHQGLQVTVLERLAAPAQATSGNAGGLFHSVLHPQDGAHARWLRAAALHTQRVLAPLQ
ncbi:MAG: oxidoreductase, partial [Burkholderiales bacterium PBB5]